MKWSDFSIPVIWDNAKDVIIRFPLAALCAVGFTLLAINQMDIGVDHSTIWKQRLMFTLGTGLPLMIGLHACCELYAKSVIQKYLILISGIALLLIIYFAIAPDFEFEHLRRPIRFLSIFLIFHLFVSVVPFLKPEAPFEFWEYNKNLLIQWYIGAFYTLVIYSGLAIALVAVDQLFEIHIEGKLYIYIFFIIAFFYHPIFFLSGYPLFNLKTEDKVEWIKALKVLVNYILIPMSMLYFVILYAFGFKILANWQLPHGWVSSLVLGFSGVGIFSFLLNFKLADLYENKLSRFYKKYFYYGLLPLVFLLFVAIFRRLSDYGFTPPRYFVLITGIWLLGICIYFIFSKKDNIKWIPLSLMGFLIVGTMSPIDAFETTVRNQKHRIQKNLEAFQLMEAGRMKSDLSSLPVNEKEQVKEMMREIKSIGALDDLYDIIPTGLVMDSLIINQDEYALFEKLGLMDSTQMNAVHSQTRYLSYYDRNSIPLIPAEWMFVVDLSDGSIQDSIQLDGQLCKCLILNNVVKDSISLESLVSKLEANYSDEHSNTLLEKPIDLESSQFKYRFFLKNINYEKKRDAFVINYLNGFLLCSKK